MEEGTDVPYLKGRDSQFLHELTPERVLDALPGLDVAAWKGDRAWYHPLCELPFLREVAEKRTKARFEAVRCIGWAELLA